MAAPRPPSSAHAPLLRLGAAIAAALFAGVAAAQPFPASLEGLPEEAGVPLAMLKQEAVDACMGGDGAGCDALVEIGAAAERLGLAARGCWGGEAQACAAYQEMMTLLHADPRVDAYVRQLFVPEDPHGGFLEHLRE